MDSKYIQGHFWKHYWQNIIKYSKLYILKYCVKYRFNIENISSTYFKIQFNGW